MSKMRLFSDVRDYYHELGLVSRAWASGISFKAYNRGPVFVAQSLISQSTVITTKQTSMRLDRFLKHNCGYTSQQSLGLVREGRVLVSHLEAQSVAQILSCGDQVSVDGVVVQTKEFVYIVLNKPAGVVSARRDANHPTVLGLITEEHFCGDKELFKNIDIAELQIIGRLDVDTTGLLLLTNDGDWNYRVSAPEHQCSKTYRVTLNSPLRAEVLPALSEGILLQGESVKTLPAIIEPLSEKEVLLTISEGRYHQVKRMFAASKNKVVGLHREAIAGLNLLAGLAPGEFRLLNKDEKNRISS